MGILIEAPGFKVYLSSLDSVFAVPQMDFLQTENHSCKEALE